jgi:hypothetical protein
MAFGGRAFNEEPALVSEIPGTFLGFTIQDGFMKLTSLLAAFRS